MTLAHAARVRGGARYSRAEDIRAMPSARALLVASLLTEPPYGCLGPSGNDRYRKCSLRSQTVVASQVNCQVKAALSQSIGQQLTYTGRRCWRIHRMTRTAFCRKSPRVPRVYWPGSWALGTSDGGRQGKSAAFGRAHVVGGVEVLRGSENDQAVAQFQIVKEINGAGAVGSRKFAVKPS
jgi:hypothetical protein